MSRLTVSLTEREEEIIKEKVDDGDEYDSRSAFVRSCVNSYERAEQLQHRIDELERDLEERRETIAELQEVADRVESLETELERVKREKREILDQRTENKQLVKFADAEREAAERREQRREAPVWRRAKWYVFGAPDGEVEA